MSDASEVKRWLIFDIANRTFNFDEDQEMVLASDHDSIVTKLKAELNQLKRMYDGLMVSARITRESNAATIKRQAEVIERLKGMVAFLAKQIQALELGNTGER